MVGVVVLVVVVRNRAMSIAPNKKWKRQNEGRSWTSPSSRREWSFGKTLPAHGVSLGMEVPVKRIA
jgi:hypothetical protein